MQMLILQETFGRSFKLVISTGMQNLINPTFEKPSKERTCSNTLQIKNSLKNRQTLELKLVLFEW